MKWIKLWIFASFPLGWLIGRWLKGREEHWIEFPIGTTTLPGPLRMSPGVTIRGVKDDE